MAAGVTDFCGFDVYDQPTIFDRLSDKDLSWRIYHGDIPQSILLLNQAKKGFFSNYRSFAYFEDDISKADEDFPSYVFIEPNYKFFGNDDHPPHDVMAGQNLISTIYNAIRANDVLWRNTLLIVTYDEHGGFYDHVPPPAAIPPGGTDMKEWTFDSLGLRVPTVLISPYVEKGIFSAPLEHASLLRFLIDLYGLEDLTDRTKSAKSFASVFKTQFRKDTPKTIQGGSVIEQDTRAALNELQKALFYVGKWAKRELGSRMFSMEAPAEETMDRELTEEDYDEAYRDIRSVLKGEDSEQ